MPFIQPTILKPQLLKEDFEKGNFWIYSEYSGKCANPIFLKRACRTLFALKLPIEPVFLPDIYADDNVAKSSIKTVSFNNPDD